MNWKQHVIDDIERKRRWRDVVVWVVFPWVIASSGIYLVLKFCL